MNKFIFVGTSFLLILIILIVFDHSAKIIDYTYFSYDEFTYYNRSLELSHAIDNIGFLATLDNYYAYTNSKHFLYYFVLALFIGHVGDVAIYFIAFKCLIHMLAIQYFHKWLVMVKGFNHYPLTMLVLLFYTPLSLLVISIMRDSIVFMLLAAGLYYSHKKNNIILLIVFFTLFFFRANAALALISYYLVYNFADSFYKEKYKTSIFGFITLLLLFIIVPIDRVISVLSGFFSIGWVVEIFKIVISPLPWSIDPDLPVILTPWYTFSFILILFVLLLNLSCIFNSKKNKSVFKITSLPIFLFTVVYCLPYVLTYGIGFRQAAIILPFFFFYNIISLLEYYRR